MLSSDELSDPDIPTTGVSSGSSGSNCEVSFCVRARAQLRLPRIVLGATASLSFGNFDTPLVGGGGGDASFGSLATVGGEVGYDLGEFLVYGELGHTWATRSDAGDTRRFEGGLQYGIGADYMLNEQIMIGGGVSRIDLDDFGGSDASVTTFGARAAFRF